MTIQEIYYSVATPVALISLAITIALFIRSKPDRIKAAIQASLEPLINRLDQIETANKALAAAQATQGNTLTRLEAEFRAELRHVPTDTDIQTLHARVADVLRATAEQNGRQEAYNQQLDRISQFLMRGDR